MSAAQGPWWWPGDHWCGLDLFGLVAATQSAELWGWWLFLRGSEDEGKEPPEEGFVSQEMGEQKPMWVNREVRLGDAAYLGFVMALLLCLYSHSLSHEER